MICSFLFADPVAATNSGNMLENENMFLSNLLDSIFYEIKSKLKLIITKFKNEQENKN
jgi:hypothetical protein